MCSPATNSYHQLISASRKAAAKLVSSWLLKIQLVGTTWSLSRDQNQLHQWLPAKKRPNFFLLFLQSVSFETKQQKCGKCNDNFKKCRTFEDESHVVSSISLHPTWFQVQQHLKNLWISGPTQNLNSFAPVALPSRYCPSRLRNQTLRECLDLTEWTDMCGFWVPDVNF